MQHEFGRTGRHQFAISSAPVLFADASPDLLCTYNGPVAPLTLLVVAGYGDSPPARNRSSTPVFLPANQLGAESDDMTAAASGALLIEYGAGAAVNYLIADLKSGSYALPPCDYAQVSARVWHPHATLGDQCPAVSLAATLLVGQHKNPARLTCSYMGVLAASSSFVGAIPQCARWVDLQGGHDLSNEDVVTPGALRLLEYKSGTGLDGRGVGRYLYSNWAEGVHVPDATPVELARGDAYVVYNDMADASPVSVKFFLEL